MAPLSQPTIPQGVYNRLPFLEKNANNLALINDFTVDVMSYFKVPLDLSDADYLDIDFYPICLKSVIPDLVAIMMLNRQIMINMGGKAESNGGGDAITAPTGKILKRAKAGEAETEFMLAEASKMGGLTSSYAEQVKGLIGSASAKAAACGYCLVFDGANMCACECMGDGNRGLKVYSWCDE